MNASFSQPNVVHQLALTLAKMNVNHEAISARSLADSVAPLFPDVPLCVLRVLAAKALRLYFEPIWSDDVDIAALDPEAAIEAMEFFGAALHAAAESLRDDLGQPARGERGQPNPARGERKGSNVIGFTAPAA